jgi:hypothetical protein
VETDEHRRLAIGLYNRCWELLDKAARTSDEDVELLTAAFTSRWHWLLCGASEQWIISDWMVARCASNLDVGPLALSYATRAYAALDPNSPTWLRASAAEGLALAHAVSGNAGEHERWCALARDLVARIPDEDDQTLIGAQLEATARHLNA